MRFSGSSKLVWKRDVSGGGGEVDGGWFGRAWKFMFVSASKSMHSMCNGPKEGGSEMSPMGGEGILPNAPISKP